MRVSLAISKDPASYSYAHPVRVRFAETDAMGVAHHSSYVAWLEEARVALLRSMGTPYPDIRAQGFDFAVLELFTNYRRSALFDEIVVVHTKIAGLRGATFQMDYLLTIDDDVCAPAATVHGVVDPEGRATRMPDWMRKLFVSD